MCHGIHHGVHKNMRVSGRFSIKNLPFFLRMSCHKKVIFKKDCGFINKFKLDFNFKLGRADILKYISAEDFLFN